MNKLLCTLSTPVGDELASIEGDFDQIKDTILNWIETAEDGDSIVVQKDFVMETADHNWAQMAPNVVKFKPKLGPIHRKPSPGSQEWAETRGDDIPSYDQPGDDFDAS